ncbi:MAG: hypothetical protein KF901_05715 [Myxococcales bacterium]|nr:hypothetical protein [Myxococcales bacterium]
MAWWGLGLVALLALLTIVALHLIESERGRRLVRELAADEGLALDYRQLELSPASGRFALVGLTLEMPEPCRALGDDWLAIARVEAEGSAGALLTGKLHIGRVLVEGVRARLVVDDEGRDCVALALEGLLGEEAPPPDDEATPLSRLLADLELPMGLTVDEVIVRDVRVELVDRRERVEASLDGLELRASLRSEGGLVAEVAIASPERASGTELRVVVGPEGAEAQRYDADLRFAHAARVEGASITLTSETSLERLALGAELEPFARMLALGGDHSDDGRADDAARTGDGRADDTPRTGDGRADDAARTGDGRADDAPRMGEGGVALGRALGLPRALLALEARADFVPDEARVDAQLVRLALLGDVAEASLDAALHDDAPLPALGRGHARFDLAPLVALLPPELGVVAEGVRGRVDVTPSGEDASDALRAAHVSLSAGAARVVLPDGLAELYGLTLGLEGDVEPSSARFRADVALPQLSARAEGATLALRELTFGIGSERLAMRADVPDAALPFEGALAAELRLAGLRASAEGADLALESLALEAALPAQPDQSVSLSPTVRVALGELDARAPGASVRWPSATVELSARELRRASGVVPVEGHVDARLRAPQVEARAGAERVSAEALDVSLSGRLGADPALDVTTRARALRAAGAGPAVEVRALDLRAGLSNVALDERDLPRSRATLSLETRTERVGLRDAGQHVIAAGLGFTLRGRYAGAAPSSLSGTVPLGGLRVLSAGQPELALPGGTLSFEVGDLRVNPDVPLRSSATLRVRGRLASAYTLDVGARLADGAAEADAHLHVAPLGALGALVELPESVRLAEGTLDLRARGRYGALESADPSLSHHLELVVERIGVREEGADLHLPRVALTVDHQGRGASHEAQLRLRVASPRLNDETLSGELTLRADARLDGAAQRAHVEVRAAGLGELELEATLDAHGEAGGRVRHTERVITRGLDGLTALLPPSVRAGLDVDLARIGVEIEGGGTLDHVVDLRAGGVDPALAREAAFEQELRAHVTGVRYAPEGLKVEVPETRFELRARGDVARVVAEVDLHVPLVDVEDSLHHVTLHGAEQQLRFESRGPLEDAHFDVHVDAQLARVEQDFSPVYPMEQVVLGIDFGMSGLDAMELRRLELVNARAGTRLELSKTLTRSRAVEVDLAASADGLPADLATNGDGPARRAARGGEHLVLRGQLTQDLSRLDAAPDALRARGRVSVPFTLESGDGSLFRAHATMRLEDVNVELPELGVVLEGVRANVPVEEAFEWTSDGSVHLVANTERNPFARVRYQDLQPFLSSENFLEVARVRVGEIELGPIVGSLVVDRNVFAVHGIRIERGEAIISGQLLVDYLPGAERVQFRGNVTGLRTRNSNSPLDANAAVVFTPSRLELDGRIQIVRVTTSHLRGLLDLVDPFREDPSLNSLRSALRFGHPRRVTINLSQGLMSLDVKMGGVLGSLINISEIRGIALGPFMNRHVAPLLPEL